MTEENMAPRWWLRFWVVFIGQAVSQLGSAVTQFVLLWWITDATASVAAVATAGIVGLLPQALLSPLGGAMADRVSRRMLMIVADAVSAGCVLVLMALFLTAKVELWHVYVLVFVRSSMQAFQVPAAAASMALLVPRDFLPRAAGLNQTLQGVTAIAAAPLGALAMATMPLGWALSIDVVTAGLAVGALLCFRIPQPTAVDAQHGSVWKTLADGFAFIYRDRGLRQLYALLAGVMLLVMPAFALVPLLSKSYFGQGAAHVAAVQGFLGVGMVAGGVLMAALAPRRQVPWILVGFAVTALTVTGIALTPPAAYALAPLWWGVTGLAFVAGNAPLVALIQLTVPNEMHGRAFALLSAVVGLAAPIGLAAAGPVGEIVGVRGLFIGMGVLGALCCLLGFASPALNALGARTASSSRTLATDDT